MRRKKVKNPTVVVGFISRYIVNIKWPWIMISIPDCFRPRARTPPPHALFSALNMCERCFEFIHRAFRVQMGLQRLPKEASELLSYLPSVLHRKFPVPGMCVCVRRLLEYWGDRERERFLLINHSHVFLTAYLIHTFKSYN